MGDPSFCGGCGYLCCECEVPTEASLCSVHDHLCGKCGGCYGSDCEDCWSCYPVPFLVWCRSCGASGKIIPPEPPDEGFLSCPDCGAVITEIDVSPFASLIENRVNEKRQLQAVGKLGTRIQTTRASDAEIDRDGLGAEIAACLILCPSKIGDFLQLNATGGNNRGRDFPAEWLHLDRPLEIKHTRYRGKSTGYLLVRPPRWTPGGIRPEHIDDSIYVLLTGKPPIYRLEGWADREWLLIAGVKNPVPCGRGQRECWGIHWSKMRPVEQLAEKIFQTY